MSLDTVPEDEIARVIHPLPHRTQHRPPPLSSSISTASSADHAPLSPHERLSAFITPRADSEDDDWNFQQINKAIQSRMSVDTTVNNAIHTFFRRVLNQRRVDVNIERSRYHPELSVGCGYDEKILFYGRGGDNSDESDYGHAFVDSAWNKSVRSWIYDAEAVCAYHAHRKDNPDSETTHDMLKKLQIRLDKRNDPKTRFDVFTPESESKGIYKPDHFFYIAFDNAGGSTIRRKHVNRYSLVPRVQTTSGSRSARSTSQATRGRRQACLEFSTVVVHPTEVKLSERQYKRNVPTTIFTAPLVQDVRGNLSSATGAQERTVEPQVTEELDQDFTAHASCGLAQGATCLLGCAETYGTWLGAALIDQKFCRLTVLGDRTLGLETARPGDFGQIMNTVDALSADRLARSDTWPCDIGTAEGAEKFKQYVHDGIDVLGSLQVRNPFHRLDTAQCTRLARSAGSSGPNASENETSDLTLRIDAALPTSEACFYADASGAGINNALRLVVHARPELAKAVSYTQAEVRTPKRPHRGGPSGQSGDDDDNGNDGDDAKDGSKDEEAEDDDEGRGKGPGGRDGGRPENSGDTKKGDGSASRKHQAGDARQVASQDKTLVAARESSAVPNSGDPDMSKRIPGAGVSPYSSKSDHIIANDDLDRLNRDGIDAALGQHPPDWSNPRYAELFAIAHDSEKSFDEEDESSSSDTTESWRWYAQHLPDLLTDHNVRFIGMSSEQMDALINEVLGRGPETEKGIAHSRDQSRSDTEQRRPSNDLSGPALWDIDGCE